MIQDLLDVASQHPYLSLVGVFILYQILSSISYRYKSYKLGAYPLRDTTQGLAGFRFAKAAFQARNDGTYLQMTRGRFFDSGQESITFRFAGFRMISTIDPENIKAILATQFNDFALGKRHRHFFPLLGDGIFTLDGAYWKHSRAMLRPQFTREQVEHTKSLEPHFQMFAKQVRAKANPGEPLDLQELIFNLTLDSATEFLFGDSVDSLKDGLVEEAQTEFDGKKGFVNAFNEAQVYLLSRTMFQELYFLLNLKSFRENCKHVHRFCDFYVNKALQATPQELEAKSEKSYVFLYELVKETRDPIVLRDQLLNILLAGRDTTAGLLSFSFIELAHRPDVLKRLKEEVYKHFGGPECRGKVDTSQINFELLKKCDYLKAFINEVLRMYPPVPQNFRTATKDTTLPRGGGPNGDKPFFVQKGQNVLYVVSTMQRNPKYYGKDADVFRPERWFEADVRKLGWAYLPFNGGPRICLGQQFALTEGAYIIVRILQTFPQLFSYEKTYPPRELNHLTLMLMDGLQVGFKETE